MVKVSGIIRADLSQADADDRYLRMVVGSIIGSMNGSTMASGTGTITVTHGLNGTPTAVLAFGTHTEVDLLYAANVGATTFQIVASDGVTSANRTIYWFAGRVS